MTTFTERVIQILKEIPSGSFMSYGQVAEMAGSPRGARQVVRILSSCSEKYGLPWHRVVNAKGQIALVNPDAVDCQRKLLESEGISFLDEITLDPVHRYKSGNL